MYLITRLFYAAMYLITTLLIALGIVAAIAQPVDYTHTAFTEQQQEFISCHEDGEHFYIPLNDSVILLSTPNSESFCIKAFDSLGRTRMFCNNGTTPHECQLTLDSEV